MSDTSNCYIHFFPPDKSMSNHSLSTATELTSHPGTSFIISLSRASAPCCRRYNSRSPSAINIGTRCIRDHTFSRCSSLEITCRKSVHLPISVLIGYGGRRKTAGSKKASMFALSGKHATFHVQLTWEKRTVLTVSQDYPYQGDRNHTHK